MTHQDDDLSDEPPLASLLGFRESGSGSAGLLIQFLVGLGADGREAVAAERALRDRGGRLDRPLTVRAGTFDLLLRPSRADDAAEEPGSDPPRPEVSLVAAGRVTARSQGVYQELDGEVGHGERKLPHRRRPIDSRR